MKSLFSLIALFSLILGVFPGIFVISENPSWFIGSLIIFFVSYAIYRSSEDDSSDEKQKVIKKPKGRIYVKPEKDKFALYMNGQIYQNYVYGRDNNISNSYPKLVDFIFKSENTAKRIASLINNQEVYTKIDDNYWILDAGGRENYLKKDNDQICTAIKYPNSDPHDSWSNWDNL